MHFMYSLAPIKFVADSNTITVSSKESFDLKLDAIKIVFGGEYEKNNRGFGFDSSGFGRF